MKGPRFILATGVVPFLVLATACSSGGGSDTNASTDTATTSPPTASAPASPTTPADSGTAALQTPCQLVTAAEASALAGVNYAAGAPSDTGNGGHRCTYGAGTAAVFFVQTGSGSSAEDAQSQWAQTQQEIQQNLTTLVGGGNIAANLADVPGLGDKAAVGTGTINGLGQPINYGDIAVLKGANLLAFGELTAGTAPTAAGLQAQAETSLARMP